MKHYFSLILLVSALNIYGQKLFFGEKKTIKCEALNNKEFEVTKVKVKASSSEMNLSYYAGICQISETYKKSDLSIGTENFVSNENLAVKDASGVWLIYKKLGAGSDINDFKDVAFSYAIGAEENFFASMDKSIISKSETAIKQILKDKYLAKLPQNNFVDEMGISGIYYLSKPSLGSKIVTALSLEFIPENYKVKIYYDEKVPPIDRSIHYKNFKKLKYVSFRGDTGFEYDVLNCAIYPIDKDMFLFFNSKLAQWKMDSDNCSDTNFNDPDEKCFIAGKNKEKVEQIATDKELFKKLANQALEKYCVAYNQDIAYTYASKYPFPEPGMKDANVVTAATEGIKKHAAIAKWEEKIEYCYIKSNEWTVYRDKITNEILYRTLRLIAVMSHGNECKWEEFSVKQDYVNGSYGKTTYNGNTQLIIPIDCAESKKNK